MQEKDIREKLNQELDEMAPDILNKILQTPMEPVKSEKELLGKNKPLYKKKRDIKKIIWAPAMVAVAACIAVLVMMIQPTSIQNPVQKQSDIAFGITIDVNPSISIEVDKAGKVEKINADNKDAKKIVKQVNKQVDENTDYNKAVKLVVKQLNENGYLKKKKNGMLVSVISEDKKYGKEKLEEIKEQTKKVEKNKKIKCTTVYQVCEKNSEAVKVAEKNNVSIGKAALCMKLAEKENTSVKKMCKKNIDTLVKKAEKSNTVIADDEIIIDEVETVSETEDITFETESIDLETESAEESTEMIEETTVPEVETGTEEQTAGITEPETTYLQVTD